MTSKRERIVRRLKNIAANAGDALATKFCRFGAEDDIEDVIIMAQDIKREADAILMITIKEGL